jgi:hypothetical protein
VHPCACTQRWLGSSTSLFTAPAAHRTGVAKIPYVLEWLSLVLGLSGKGSGHGGTSAAGAGDGKEQGQKQDEDSSSAQGAADAGGEAAPKVLIFAHHK